MAFFLNPYDRLDLPRVYSMVFTQIHYLVIYHILSFCTLVSITIINLHLDGFSDSVPVQILTTHCFHSIHYWKKYIRITLILYINLDYWRNTTFILTRDKFKLILLPPQEEQLWYVWLLYLSIRLGSFHWYWSVIYRKIYHQVI